MMYVPGIIGRRKEYCSCNCHEGDASLKSFERRVFEMIDSGSTEELTAYMSDIAIDRIVIRELFNLAEGTAILFVDYSHLDDVELYSHPMIIKAAYDFLRRDNSELKIIIRFDEGDKNSLIDNKFLLHLPKFKNRIHVYEAINELKNNNFEYLVVPSYDWYAMTIFENNYRFALFNDSLRKGKDMKGLRLVSYCDFVIKDKTRSLPIDQDKIWRE